jgi:Carbohydrate-selective porin, OprB family
MSNPLIGLFKHCSRWLSGMVAGYPDKTYRGNRALTRYEFAAGLNACLDRVNELIAAATADLIKKEDLATLQKLREEFAAELATLRGRVDSLEARTTTLEKQ